MNEYLLYLRYGFAIYSKQAPQPDEDVFGVSVCMMTLKSVKLTTQLKDKWIKIVSLCPLHWNSRILSLRLAFTSWSCVFFFPLFCCTLPICARILRIQQRQMKLNCVNKSNPQHCVSFRTLIKKWRNTREHAYFWQPNVMYILIWKNVRWRNTQRYEISVVSKSHRSQ